MRKKRRMHSSRSHERYAVHSYGRYRRDDEGCFSGIARFFTNLFYGLLIGGLSILIVGFIITHFQQTIAFISGLFAFISFLISIFPLILHYGFILACIFAGLGLLYGLIRLVSAISERLAEASARRARAGVERARLKQEKLETEQRQIEVQRRQVRLAQESYTYDERKRRGYMQESQESVEGRRYATRHLPQELAPEQEQEQEEKSVIPGMPPMGTYYYRDYAQAVRPGQLLVGIQKNGKPRIGTWADVKVVLDLGGSASGKTTTIAQQCLAIVRDGGMLALCDPHAHKKDSLLRKVYPLRYAAFPGTVLAVEHTDILRNIQVVKAELDKRVQGADCSIPLCLVVEEMNRLQRDKAIANALTEILQIIGQEGRGYNVYAIIGAQQISHFAGIRKSVISFVIHRVDESEAQLCIPARFAKYASELAPGQTFVKDADGMTEALQQTLTTAQDIEHEGAMLAQRSTHRQTQAFYARETEDLRPRSQVPPRRVQPVVQPVDLEDEETQRKDYGRGATGSIHKMRLQSIPDLQPTDMQNVQPADNEEDVPVPIGPTTDKLDTASRVSLATWGETEKSQVVMPSPSSQGAGTQFKRPLGTSRPLATSQPIQQSQPIDLVKESQNNLASDKVSQLEQIRNKKRNTKKIS